MSFDVAADAYDRFMGRYAVPLAPEFADFARIERNQRVIDVGSGPGALTDELVRRVGSDSVVAVDPSEPFVAALRQRRPNVRVEVASAEALPFADDEFDAALAQLVVHFMSDPVAGLAEMARVTRSGGIVAACTWDFGSDRAPLSLFWSVARELDGSAPGESALAGTHEGQLTELFARAGLEDVEETGLEISTEHLSFEEWWEPYTFGVGPVGSYVARLDEERRTALRERLRERLPPSPFVVSARAWAARGRVR
jgi:SAM-dependent methyltransferase